MSRLAIILIQAYQQLISPLLGSHCRFYPTCSNYALSVYREWGFLRGSWLTLKRIIRCGPWSEGGVDFPPQKGDIARS
ncbi:MAG: membrane protein insertion efficiency factor YidD [Synergistaceae bacterium]|nr:membrane protein insertion efficiency factor YidD [Synergistaceae bacterium]MBR0151633.1 membrane protein insertion efficiency factor YidD [Synergistaceae bacterium]MBR0257707.1 membrane protein insertion efficiency factor YidD [Synergistaceae bacterium]